MPWQHAIGPEGGTFEAGEELEFTSVPTYILVGPDGLVLLDETSLDELEATLAERFGTAD